MRCPKHCTDIPEKIIRYLKFEFNQASCILSGLDPLICKYSVMKRAGIWPPRPRPELTSWEPLILRHFPRSFCQEHPGPSPARALHAGEGAQSPHGPAPWRGTTPPSQSRPRPVLARGPRLPRKVPRGGSEATEVGVPEAALPWSPRRTGWWNPCACKSCGPGTWALGLEPAGRADGRRVERAGNPGVGWAGLVMRRGPASGKRHLPVCVACVWCQKSGGRGR